jgi:hypothetical protein
MNRWRIGCTCGHYWIVEGGSFEARPVLTPCASCGRGGDVEDPEAPNLIWGPDDGAWTGNVPHTLL